MMKRWSLMLLVCLLAAAVVPVTASAVAPLTNLALNKPATTGTGDYCNSSSETAAQAVDGSTSTKWCHTGTDWLQVDLGGVYNVSEFVVTNAGNENANYITQAYTLATSTDGSAWTTVANVTNNTANVATSTIAPVPARYVKLDVISPVQGGGGAIRIYEFAVKGDPQPLPAAPANVSAAAGDGQATLQWDFVSGAAAYAIYAGTAPGSYGADPVDTVDGSMNTYMASGLTNGTTYYFAVTAVDASGTSSGYSSEASATPRSGNADLSNLTLSSGTLDPSFDAATTSYAASIPNSVGKIMVTPTADDPNATITVGGHPTTSGWPSDPIDLQVGSNTIDIVVTAQNGIATTPYTITVTRASDIKLISAQTDAAGQTVLTFSEPLVSGTIVPGAFLLRNGGQPVAVTQVIYGPECDDTVKLVVNDPIFKWDRITLDVPGNTLQSQYGSWLSAVVSRSVQNEMAALSPDFPSGHVHLDGMMSYLQRRQFDIDADGNGSFDRADIELMLAHIQP